MANSIYSGVNIPFSTDHEQFTLGLKKMRGEVGVFTANLNKELKDSYAKMDGYSRRLSQGVGRMAKDLEQTGRNITTYITAPILALSAASFKAYAELDAMRKGFDVLTGSAELSTKYMKELTVLSRNPGLGMMEVQKAALRWMSLGESIGTAQRRIKEIGNANALGGGGREQFETIMMQMAQMQSKGKILAEDLKPILSASPVIAKALNDRYGTIDSEAISNKLKADGKSSREFIETLIGDLEKLGRAQNSAKNAWENITDSIKVFGAAVGGMLDKSLGITPMLDSLSNGLMGIADTINELSPATRTLIVGLGALAVGIGPLYIGTGLLLGSMTKLPAVLQASTAGWAALNAVMSANAFYIAMAAVVALGAVMWANVGVTKEAKTAKDELNEAMRQGNVEVRQEIGELNKLVKIAQDEKNSKQERLAAIDKINKISPEHLGNISLETIGLSKTNQQLATYIKLMRLKATSEVLTKKYQSKYGELMDAGNLSDLDHIGLALSDQNILGIGGGIVGAAKDLVKGRVDKLVPEVIQLGKAMGAVNTEIAKMESSSLFGSGKGGNPTGQGALKGKKGTVDKYTDAEWKKDIMSRANDIANDPKFLSEMALQNALSTKLGTIPANVKSGLNTNSLPALTGIAKPTEYIKTVTADMKETADNINSAFNSMTGNLAAGFGEFLGEFAKGNAGLADLGTAFRNIVGQSLIDLGKATIAQATAKVAIVAAKSLGTLGIGALFAAGTGAIAVGSLIKANGSGAGTLRGSRGDGMVGGSVDSTRYTSPTYGATSSSSGTGRPMQIDLNLSGQFVINGDDLMYIINRKVQLQPRI